MPIQNFTRIKLSKFISSSKILNANQMSISYVLSIHYNISNAVIVLNILPYFRVLVALYHGSSKERTVREIYLAFWVALIYVPLKGLMGVTCMSERTGVYRVLVVGGTLGKETT
jgi:hypothetical protein